MTSKIGRSTGVAPTAPRLSLPYDSLGMDARVPQAGHPRSSRVHARRAAASTWTASGSPTSRLALAVRDRLIERWIRTQDTYYEQRRQARLLPVARVPHGPHARQQPGQPGPARRVRTQALHELGYDLEDLREAEWDAGLGNGGLAGSPRASSTRWPRSATRPTATASATTTASSTSASSTARRSRRPTAGCATATRGRSPARATGSASSSAAASSTTSTPRAGSCNEWVDTQRRARDALRHARSPATATQTVNTLRLWGAKAIRRVRPRRVQRGRLHRRHRGARPVREHLPGPLPERQRRSPARSSGSPQEYFFVSATLQDIIRRYKKRYQMFDEPRGLRVFDRFAEKVAIQLNDTHPALAIPELMRILVDVEGLDWDEAWDITTRDLRLHEPHRPARGARALAGGPARPPAAAPPRRSSTRSTTASSTRCASRFGADDDALPAHVDHRGGRRAARAHGHLAIVGSHSVNGVAALHTEILKRRRLPRLPRAVAREVQQQDQRHHPAPLAAQEQPRRCRALITEADRRRAGSPTSTQLRGARAAGRRRAPSASAWRHGQARQQAAPRRDHPRGSTSAAGIDARPSTRTRSSTCQVKRIHEYKRQLLNVLHVITLYNRIQDGPARRHRPAHRHLRRQGGARLRHGQADHPADQRRRRRGQRRPGRRGTC